MKEEILLPKLDKMAKEFMDTADLNSFIFANPQLWGKPLKEIKKVWRKTEKVIEEKEVA